MLPLSAWPLADRRRIIGVFTDIDDTLTTKGAITSDALTALADLQAAGLIVIPITGRHSGWCEPLIAGHPDRCEPWPVNAIVAENGAVAFVPQPARGMRGLLSKIYQQDARTRVGHHTRMQAVGQRVLREVPGAVQAHDVGGRETDIAFDYNEHVHLDPVAIEQIVGIFQSEGMFTSVSSIHIHGCFDDFNKWSGACWIVRQLLQHDLSCELDRWVFVGDSGNDQSMFQHFKHSVGVANIQHVAAQLSHLPRYITLSERGAGFVEVAHAILAAPPAKRKQWDGRSHL